MENNSQAATPLGSGRAAALARRQALSRNGKSAIAAARVGGQKTPGAAMSKASAHAIPASFPDEPPCLEMPCLITAKASGRDFALARRQAMAQTGKAALTPTAQGGAGTSAALRSAAAMRQSARVEAQRQAAATLEGESERKACPCGCGGACGCADGSAGDAPKSAFAARRMEASVAAAGDAGPSGTPLSQGRAYAMARRAALATQGKKGVAAMRAASTLAGVGLLRNETLGQAVAQGLSGRQIAMARRAEQSLQGRGKAGNLRPSAHLRPAVAKGEAVPKVERSETLKGKTVTGTSVERRQRVTGNEAGSTRAITGTEYVGAGQFEQFGKGRPAPGPDKVASTQTSRGRTVTGTPLERSAKVTGNEAGSRRTVSGTEYIGNEEFQPFRRETPHQPPAKAGGASRGGRGVTGSQLGRSAAVTGDEAGAGRQISGSQYFPVTQNGRMETGSLPRRSGEGAPSRSVGVTGSQVGRGQRVTGDEAGASRSVTGSAYVSPEQYKAFCDSLPASPAREAEAPGIGEKHRVTGSTPGRGTRVTGNERGHARPVTGTPYAGAAGDGQAGRAQQDAVELHPRFSPDRQATPDEQVALEPPTAAAGRADFSAFSVVSPARAARQRITGTVSAASARITGPVNLAASLVSGTPEFRYQADAADLALPPEAAAQPEPAAPARERITGEGRQEGHRITGDAWQRSGRITGTEGSSSMSRNPTLRGASRAALAGAQANRGVERPEAPATKITGSAGATVKGPLVTVSGGARG